MDERKPPEALRENKQNVEIITLTPDDWQSYRDLRIKAHTQEPTAFRSTVEEAANRPESEWRKSLEGGQSGGDILLFAKSENELIGLIGIRLEQAEKLRHVAAIFFVFVDAESRGSGVGDKLMQVVFEKLQQLKFVKKVKLGVYDTQKTAANLYKKYGFEQVGVEKNEQFDGTQYHDHILMEKVIE